MSSRGLLVDPKPNSLHLHHGNCEQTLKRINKEILGVKGLTLTDKSLSFEKC